MAASASLSITEERGKSLRNSEVTALALSPFKKIKRLSNHKIIEHFPFPTSYHLSTELQDNNKITTERAARH